ncbi:polyketide synthase dehydratase domain-containing protein, partial [Microbispora corallina]|uniref:polyketide synthase dehydratase domain-containing protein n=1 Tax=Microbispora corallina TaxID=83302 RepID=UPI0031E0DFEC
MTGTVQLQTLVSGPDRRTVEIYSRPEGSDGDWTRHATVALASESPAPSVDLAIWPPPGARPVDLDDAYERLSGNGLHYGPAFRGLRAAWRRGNELFAEVALPQDRHDEAGRFGIHPALLDAALHAAALQWLDETEPGVANLPFAWSGMRLHASGATHLRVRAVLGEAGSLSLQATDPSGTPVISVEALQVRPVRHEQVRTTADWVDGLYRVEWEPLALEAAEPGSWAVLGDHGLAEALRGTGVSVSLYPDLTTLTDAVQAGEPTPDLIVLPITPHTGTGTDTDTDTDTDTEAGSAQPTHNADDPVAAAHHVLEHTLLTLQTWLTDDHLATTRLLALTHHATPLPDQPDQPPLDLAIAPVLG